MSRLQPESQSVSQRSVFPEHEVQHELGSSGFATAQSGAEEPRFCLGDAAFAYLDSEDFLQKWQRLQEQCPWATAFQAPDFVLPWYRIYRDTHLPVLIFEEANGEFAALVTLALRRDSRRVVGAGDVQAEYQCWLEPTPGAGGLFLRRALRMLEQSIPGMHLSLRYLPPGTPLGWLAATPPSASWCRIESHPLPLMEVSSASAASPLTNRKADVKRRSRKLEKFGALQFEQITDREQFALMFDELCDQYDFRQAAAYNGMPFSEDSRKRDFHLELQRRGMLFTTILKVGERIAASHCAMLTGRRILHHCFGAHLPALSARGPGILHLAFLETHLARAGIPVFDLTPGPSRHKANFATATVVAFEFNAYHGMLTYLKHQAPSRAKRLLKQLLEKRGVDLRRFRLSLAAGLRFIRSSLVFHAKQRFVCRQSPVPVGDERVVVSKDRLSDLLRFNPGYWPLARQDFFSTAMARLEGFGHVYTGVEDRRLLYSCWVEKPLQDSERTMAPVALFDLREYEKSADANGLSSFLAAVVADIRASGVDNVSLIGSFNKRTRRAIERCGFVTEKKMDGVSMSSDI